MQEEIRTRIIKARKKIIESEFSKLNEMQRKAVLSTEGPLLLLAGAGSGKTTVLINRIVNLIRFGRASDCDLLPSMINEKDLALLEKAAYGELTVEEKEKALELCALEKAEPWQILAITFTNKAADELKHRLSLKLGEKANDVWAMTFHAACVRILRRYADRLGFESGFTIYDQQDSLSVMKQVIKELDIDEKIWPPKAMLSASNHYKEEFISPETALLNAQKSANIRELRTAQIVCAYSRRLKSANAMDFDDLLYYCVVLFNENPDVLEKYQHQFRYVLIDEYQDTNHLQYLMASKLAGGRKNICVVGDDDQSIYKFRGATIENILNFEEEYSDSRVIRLEQNYRSTGNILAAANEVIKHNRNRKGKTLWTEAPDGEKIVHFTSRDEGDEADFVARTVSAGNHPGDCAVLYRTNAQSRMLELSFKRFKIPYKVYGGTRFFDRAEVKDMLAYLCVIANPTDETRLVRIVNNPARGIGASSLESAQKIARTMEVPLFTVLQNATEYKEISSRSSSKMVEFSRMILLLQESVTKMELDAFYDLVLEKTGYAQMLVNKKTIEDEARLENIQELKSAIMNNIKENGGDLYGFLDEVALYTDLDNYDDSGEYATMMTMHAAKGLEFPTVFIVGAEEGLFPGLQAIGDEEEMEETRRLCYVAITRAQSRLFITSANQRMLYGKTSANEPSRFITEIPPELIEKRGVRRPEADKDPFSDFGGFSDFTSLDYLSSPRYPSKRDIKSRLKANDIANISAERARITSKKETPPALSLMVGDVVEHTVFGRGVVSKLTPMGGDALLEISFDSVGSKKLMMRVASQHMKKLSE